MTQDELRRMRLSVLTESGPYHDPEVEEIVESTDGRHVPRYLLETSEGSGESSYRDNPNYTLHETIASVEEQMAGEAAEGWIANYVIDLDTEEHLSFNYNARVYNPDLRRK